MFYLLSIWIKQHIEAAPKHSAGEFLSQFLILLRSVTVRKLGEETEAHPTSPWYKINIFILFFAEMGTLIRSLYLAPHKNCYFKSFDSFFLLFVQCVDPDIVSGPMLFQAFSHSHSTLFRAISVGKTFRFDMMKGFLYLMQKFKVFFCSQLERIHTHTPRSFSLTFWHLNKI